MTASYERRVQNQFGGFCTRVLKNEANRIHAEYARQRSREKSWDELTDEELLQTAVYDRHFQHEHVFETLGYPIVVMDDQLAEAITNLSDAERTIILLYFFLGMTDKEIGKHFQVVRQSICKRRAAILKVLRKNLEEEGMK